PREPTGSLEHLLVDTQRAPLHLQAGECGWWPRTDVLATVGRCGTPEPRGAVAGRQLAGATSLEQRVGGDEALVDEEPEFGERGADVHGARGQAIWDRIVVPVVGDE